MSELPASRSGWTLAAIDHVLDDGTLEDGRRLLKDVTADATLAGWVVWLVQRREQLGVVSGFDRIIGWKVLQLFPLLADRVVVGLPPGAESFLPKRTTRPTGAELMPDDGPWT